MLNIAHTPCGFPQHQNVKRFGFYLHIKRVIHLYDLREEWEGNGHTLAIILSSS